MGRAATAVLAAAALLVASASGAAIATKASVLPTAIPPFPFVELVRATRAMGDSHPTSAVWVASRHATAVSVTMGDGVRGNEPVFVAVLRGNFTANSVSHPFGTKAPTGTVAVFVYDARTGTSTDVGLSRRMPNLRRLGVVHDFLPYLDQAAVGTTPGTKRIPKDVPASIETQWLQRLSAGSRLGCRTRFHNLTASSILRRLNQAAAAGAFTVTGLRFLHACQAAPLIQLTASDPHRLVAQLASLERSLDRVLASGRTVWAFEGIFIEASDRSGKSFMVVWNHVRAEVAGGQWAASPDLNPFPHG